MKKVIVILTVSLSITWALGKVSAPTDEKVRIDPRVVGYVKEWCWAMETAGIPWEERLRQVKSIEVVPYSVDSRKVGLTNRFTHRITINENYIKRNPCGVRSTVFHELGHAAFDLPHGCCFIMNAESEPNEQQYCDRWNLYVAEYLVQCKKADHAK